jgi:hypothetical protein
MPQVFHRSSNTLARLSLVTVGAVVVSGVLIGSNLSRSPYVTQVGAPVDQPVPFSHKHHVKELGIDCRYCHNTAETSAVASVPSTHTCMSCHSQVWTNSPLLEPVRQSYLEGKPIEWNKVYDLPDFVYFNHSIHIQKGIGCDTCHGPIHEMNITYKAQPLSMSWCLDCHRQPEKYIRPREEVFNYEYKPPKNQLELGKKLVEEYGIRKEQLTDCSVCHR